MTAGTFAFERIEMIDRAADVEAVAKIISNAGNHFGLGKVIMSGVPEPNRKLDPYLILTTWPEGWYRRYDEHNYLHSDPVIVKLRSSTMPVAWHEAEYDASNKAAHAVMTEATEFKLRNGLSVPIFTLSGDQAAVSFGGEKYDLSGEDRAALHLIALYGHARAIDLKTRELQFGKSAPAPRARPLLTRREVEILKWVAAGKTSDVIGEILSISTATVETHIVNACRKLDAVNRTQAVAEAIRCRLIT